MAEKQGTMIRLRVIDVEVPPIHNLIFPEGPGKIRMEAWEKLRGRSILVETPPVPVDWDCGGRVFRLLGPEPWLAPGSGEGDCLCEHYFEVGD